MTTYNFQPSVTAPFLFQPTLDGALYHATVIWNLYGQRWYLQLTDLVGNVIFVQPLVPSQIAEQISTAVWSFTATQVTVTTVAPHGYPIAATLPLTISGMTPAAYNGTFDCFVTGPSTFVYDLSTNPGTATAFGTFAYNVNMLEGYFVTSTLVWRADNNQFEVLP